MNKNLLVLTKRNELFNDVLSNWENDNVQRIKTSESVKAGELFLLLVDAEIFLDEDNIQFYLSKIRKKILEIPVIIIVNTATKESLNMEWFFDDFIIYPFRKGELTLRINKFLVKNNLIELENIITVGNVKINLTEYAVYFHNEKLDFTYKEFELLRHLFQNKGQVFSRKELLSRIWGIEYIGGTRTVDVHIRRLRSKLGEEFNSIIETVRNVGYRCVDPDSLSVSLNEDDSDDNDY